LWTPTDINVFESRGRLLYFKKTVLKLMREVWKWDFVVKSVEKRMHPILHSNMGWQYQQVVWVKRLKDNGIVQNMSRKGNCLDNAVTEQVFGHLKDEFFRGQRWDCYESFERDLNNYVVFWNTQRRQLKLKGLTPEEFRCQSLGT
jgi:transposase InsO family protein